MSTGCVHLHPIGRNISKNRKTYLKKRKSVRKKKSFVYIETKTVCLMFMLHIMKGGHVSRGSSLVLEYSVFCLIFDNLIFVHPTLR
jgi:hypothetical protein